MAFLNHIPNGNILVVDHINNISTDNRLENLQVVTNRKNSTKDMKGFSSDYIGVSWCEHRKKWRARISHIGRNKSLGRFKNEHDAHLAYQKALKEISDGIFR